MTTELEEALDRIGSLKDEMWKRGFDHRQKIRELSHKLHIERVTLRPRDHAVDAAFVIIGIGIAILISGLAGVCV